VTRRDFGEVNVRLQACLLERGHLIGRQSVTQELGDGVGVRRAALVAGRRCREPAATGDPLDLLDQILGRWVLRYL